MDPKQLLSLLRDIHIPEGVSFWPLAPIWWIILALLIIAGVVSFAIYLKGRLKRRALSAVQSFLELNSSAEVAAETLMLIKSLGLKKGLKWEGNIWGKTWLDEFSELPNDLKERLITLPYQKRDFNDQRLNARIVHFAKEWIEKNV